MLLICGIHVLQIYVIAEGVSSNLYKKMHNLKVNDVTSGKLLRVLEKMKWKLKTPEEVRSFYFVGGCNKIWNF